MKTLDLIKLLQLYGLDLMNLYISPICENYGPNISFFINNITLIETGYMWKHLGKDNPFGGSCFEYSELVLLLFCVDRHVLDVDIFSIIVPRVVHIETHFHHFDIIVFDQNTIYLSDYYQEARRDSDLWTRKIDIDIYTALIIALKDKNYRVLENIIGYAEEFDDVDITIFALNTIFSYDMIDTFKTNIDIIVKDVEEIVDVDTTIFPLNTIFSHDMIDTFKTNIDIISRDAYQHVWFPGMLCSSLIHQSALLSLRSIMDTMRTMENT